MSAYLAAVLASAAFGLVLGMDVYAIIVTRPNTAALAAYTSALRQYLGLVIRASRSLPTAPDSYLQEINAFLTNEANRGYILAIVALWGLLLVIVLSAVVSPVHPVWSAGLTGFATGLLGMWGAHRLSG